MKALVLSGGQGTRLRPLTFSIPKQLIPVAGKPVLHFVIEDILKASIKNIGIIIAPETGNCIKKSLKENFPHINFQFIVQEKPLGLAHAVKISKNYLSNDDFIMYLGDNLIKGGIKKYIEKFEKEKPSAFLLFKEVENPERFGVAEFDKNGKIKKLIEKPKNPPSKYALVGFYIFSSDIFEAIEEIKPSWRGEYEITDAIQILIKKGRKVSYSILKDWWLDTGKKDDLLEANRIVLDDYAERKIEGEIVNSLIVGRVEVKKGAKIIDSIVKGPCVIGKDTFIKQSYIGPYTSIGARCKILNSEIDFSVIMDEVEVKDIGKMSDSIIGRKAKVLKSDKLPKSLKLLIGEHSEVIL